LTGLFGIRKVLFDEAVDPGVAMFVAKTVEVLRPGKRDVGAGTTGVEGCGAIDILYSADNKELVSW
jgi:hypothetical protein